MATSISALTGAAAASGKKTALTTVALTPFTLPIVTFLQFAGVDPVELSVLGYVIFIDFILGVMKSIVMGTTSSRRIWEGVFSKTSVILAIIGVSLAVQHAGAAMGFGGDESGRTVAQWLIMSAIAAEGVSIARNFVVIRTKKELPEFDALTLIWSGLISRIQKAFEAFTK